MRWAITHPQEQECLWKAGVTSVPPYTAARFPRRTPTQAPTTASARAPLGCEELRNRDLIPATPSANLCLANHRPTSAQSSVVCEIRQRPVRHQCAQRMSRARGASESRACRRPCADARPTRRAGYARRHGRAGSCARSPRKRAFIDKSYRLVALRRDDGDHLRRVESGKGKRRCARRS